MLLKSTASTLYVLKMLFFFKCNSIVYGSKNNIFFYIFLLIFFIKYHFLDLMGNYFVGKQINNNKFQKYYNTLKMFIIKFIIVLYDEKLIPHQLLNVLFKIVINIKRWTFIILINLCYVCS